MPATLEMEHQAAIDAFVWPTTPPRGLDAALALLDRFPFPERVLAPSPPAPPHALEVVERALDLALPADYRRFLERHDGVQDRWSRSGWAIRGTESLVDTTNFPSRASDILDFRDLTVYGYSREQWRDAIVAAREATHNAWSLGEGWLEPSEMVLIGNDSAGDLFFVDRAVRSPHGHPIARFSSESTSLGYVFDSFGTYLAWLLCKAHKHPQEWDPRLDALFAPPAPHELDVSTDDLCRRALAHLERVGVL